MLPKDVAGLDDVGDGADPYLTSGNSSLLSTAKPDARAPATNRRVRFSRRRRMAAPSGSRVMRPLEPLNSDPNPRRGVVDMAWILLFVAGLFEAAMVVGLDLSEGFTRLWPSLLTLVSGGISFFLLSVAMQSIPAGTAYAV
jgi:Small Multidrug Resistance protein